MKNFIQVLQFTFVLIIIYSLFHLVLYNITQTDDTTLLIDIVMLIKVGSLFIGSSVMLCYLQIINGLVLESNKKV